MAKRKVKKKISKKGIIKENPVKSLKRKFNLVLTNLFIFVMLFVASILLYFVSTNEFARDLFYLLSILLGSISVAFLIIFLVFIFLKLSK